MKKDVIEIIISKRYNRIILKEVEDHIANHITNIRWMNICMNNIHPMNIIGNYYMLWNTAVVKQDKNPSSCRANILVVKKGKMHE